MATTLYGNEWVGVTEPTTGVLSGQSWVVIDPSTGSGSGVVNRRNSTNTAWVPSGSVNSNLGGAVAVSGDVMTGPLTGATNLPPIDSPDFLGTVAQEGYPVALQVDLAALQKALYSQITSQVRQQFLSQFQQSSTAADIAAYNTFTRITQDNLSTVGLAIPLPIFKSDGVTATEDQLLAYSWSVVGQAFGGTGWWFVWECSSTTKINTVNTPGSRFLMANGNGAGSGIDFLINTWALAVR